MAGGAQDGMKVAVLSDGTGSRLSGQNRQVQADVEIRCHSIPWHIMKHYADYGHEDFVIAPVYRRVRQALFAECSRLLHNRMVSSWNGTVEPTGNRNGLEDWTAWLIDTGNPEMGVRDKEAVSPPMGRNISAGLW
jgi:glucose-1-phosphate cytidylyltransferase